MSTQARPRVNAKSPFYQLMLQFEKLLGESSIDVKLRHLMKLRASQLNHCSYCVHSHTQEALRDGETIERITLLTVWPEAPVYTEAEKAALELTETVTLLAQEGVPDDVYDRVREHYSEEQFHELLTIAIVINSWNRIGVTTHMTPAISSSSV